MKNFLCFLLLSVISLSSAYADLRSCFRDAQFHFHHQSPHSPGKECIGLLKQSSESSLSVSNSGKYRVLAGGNMLYVKGPEGIELMAGHQTGLRNISGVRIDEKNKSIIAIQTLANLTSYSIFNLEGVGNNRPYTVLSGKFLDGLTNVFLFPEQGEVAQVFKNLGKIVFMNLEADSRPIENGAKFKPQIRRTLDNQNAGLVSPSLVTRSTLKKEIYVLDGNNVVVIAIEEQSHKFLRKIPAAGRSEATSMIYDEEKNKLRFFSQGAELPSLSL